MSISLSASRQTWQERGGLFLLMLGAAALLWFGPGLTLGQRTVLWLGWLVGLAVVSRRGWLKLCGPVLFYDLVRVSRRSRYFLLRTCYVLFLFLVLNYVYSTTSWMHELTGSGGGETQRMARFAESFFYTFMGVQFLVLLVLTPGYVAGSIADEKERKTLEFLLATDLRNREIVLGKLVSRLANLLLIVLAGLPVLAFLQFFGGVDPNLVLLGFTAQAMTVFSMAGVSILFSVLSRRPREAIVFTYLTFTAYPALVLAFWGMAAAYDWTTISVDLPQFLGGATISGADCFDWLNAGNPIYVMIQMAEWGGGGGGEPLADIVARLNRNYLIFHGLVGVLSVSWAIARLRAVALKETYAKAATLPLSDRLFDRPAVGEDGMLWKEVFIENSWKMNWLGRGVLGLLVLASFVPLLIIFWTHVVEGIRGRPGELAEAINIYVRSVGTMVACLTLLAVTVRGANSIGAERDKQTLDALLTTPLTTDHILWAKWLGSVLSLRWAAAWLGLIWLVGLLSGGLYPLAVPGLIVAWLIYAGVFALVGIWFSITSKSTGRATLWSLLTAVFIGGTHWCLWSMCCLAPITMSRMGRDLDSRYLPMFAAGQTPPAVFAILAFGEQDLMRSRTDQWELIIFSVIGLITWTVAGLMVSSMARTRFQELVGRDDKPWVSRLPPRFDLPVLDLVDEPPRGE